MAAEPIGASNGTGLRRPDNLVGMGRRQNDSARPPKVRPVDVDGVRTVAIVTVGWGVAFVALALRQGQLNDAGNGWWLWTCLAGVGLGLLGLEYCRKRRDAIAQAALDAEAEAEEGEFDDDAIGDWSRLPPEDDQDVVAEQPPQPDQQLAPASGDHVTQPYEQAQQAPGYTTGDMPAVPGRIGSPDYAHGQQPLAADAEQHTPPPASRSHEAEPQQPADWPHPHAAPVAQQPSMPAGPVHPRQAAQHPGSSQQPEQAAAQQASHQPPANPPAQQPAQWPHGQPEQPPVQQPPQRPQHQQPAQPPPQRPQHQQPAQPPPQQPAQQAPQPLPSPPHAPPQQQPQQPAQPEPEPADPYSTGAGWYDSAAGYTPDADRARRHPRDRRPEPAQPSTPAPESPARQERSGRRTLADSEFFGADSDAPAPNSTAEFLLADLQKEEEQQEQQSASRHDRDATGDEYRGRRARGSR